MAKKEILPYTLLGNGRLLLTIGERGQATSLCWPHPDSPSHLGRLGWGLKSGTTLHPAGGRGWRHELAWNPEGVLAARHTCLPLGLVIRETAWVDSELDAYIQEFSLPPRPAADLSFWPYSHFHLDGNWHDQACFYWQRHGALVFYRRGLFIAVACLPGPRRAMCGQLGARRDPVAALAAGRLLNRQRGIGHAAAVASFGQSWPQRIVVYTMPARSLEELGSRLEVLKRQDAQRLRERTARQWRAFLARRRPVASLGENEMRLYRSSLAVLKLLQDEGGAVIAAPEIDPGFASSGGYAFCWSRDAVFIAWALAEAGYAAEAAAYYRFAGRTQGRSGLWGQRHFSTGELAPSWGRQLDETGAVLWGIYRHFELTGDQGFLQEMWPIIHKGAAALARAIEAGGGRPPRTFDLWEERRGQHAYTWAAITAGLRAAASAATTLRAPDLAHTWQQAGDGLAGAITLAFSDRRGFFRSGSGRRGLKPDASLLGLCVPFGVVAVNDPRMRATARWIEESLWHRPTGGLKRYPGDRYQGGNPWVLTTLWLALYRTAAGEIGQARRLLDWAIAQQTEAGLLPEQVDRATGAPAWATPLAWSHSFFILALLKLYGGLD